tara:strand:- start:276 stop:1595 length:1320 start_codon:yes stop_codon:yes gene_type:complete
MIKIGLKKLYEKKFLEALTIFTKLIDENNKNINALYCLANVYYELNDLKKSLIYYEKCLDDLPNSEIIINNYALALQGVGDIEKAKKLFESMIKLNPDNIKAYYGLFKLDTVGFPNKYYKYLKSLDKKNKLSLEDKSIINFVFSKSEKNNNNIKKEIYYLDKAHKYWFTFKKNYNSKMLIFYEKILINNFNQKNLTNKFNESFISNDKHIFIIGLPRSGSTLVEALLLQNTDKIYSYGETSIFDFSIFNQIKKEFFNKKIDIEKLELEIDENIIVDSVKNVYQYTKDKIIIDKSLENFFYIDIILKLFPEAKFIHTFRNTMDAQIAIYQAMLIHLPWAHSMNNISKYILNYEKVINYFKKKYPEKILDIELEKLTADPKYYSNKIYDFCNFNWSENVLEFFKNKNLATKTSSFLQIRDNIKKSKKNKYSSYYSLIKKLK